MQHVSGVQQQLRRGMIELVGVHGADDAGLVDDLLEVRQQFTDPGAVAADLLEAVGRAQHLLIWTHESRAVRVAVLRGGFPVSLVQQRLVVQQVMVRR